MPAISFAFRAWRYRIGFHFLSVRMQVLPTCAYVLLRKINARACQARTPGTRTYTRREGTPRPAGH